MTRTYHKLICRDCYLVTTKGIYRLIAVLYIQEKHYKIGEDVNKDARHNATVMQL